MSRPTEDELIRGWERVQTAEPFIQEAISRAGAFIATSRAASIGNDGEGVETVLMLRNAILALLPSSPAGWRPIETAPKPLEGEPMVPVLLSWTNIADSQITDRGVGEAYWRQDGREGDWWWANTSPGDYYADPVAESITGQITHWQPLPSPPEGQS